MRIEHLIEHRGEQFTGSHLLLYMISHKEGNSTVLINMLRVCDESIKEQVRIYNQAGNIDALNILVKKRAAIENVIAVAEEKDTLGIKGSWLGQAFRRVPLDQKA